MDKSAITFTKGSEWWLDRVTMSGRHRYPRRIRVGALGKERIYLPERTCRLELIPFTPGYYEGMRCSVCGMVDFEMGDGPYCSGCGAKVVV